IIGMRNPLPISEIYQPTRLAVTPVYRRSEFEGGRQWELPRTEYVLVNRFLADEENAIITAGPGWGKTTFLHAVFIHLLGSARTLPILFTLRQSEAITDLEWFVSRSEKVKNHARDRRILLLVDGYDEISTSARN